MKTEVKNSSIQLLFLSTLLGLFSACEPTPQPNCEMVASIDSTSLSPTEIKLVASGPGGTPSFSYAWNTGETTSEIIGSPTNSYTVTITDENACTSTAEIIASVCDATIQDIDGNTYNVVRIGTQCWTKENYACKRFRDGTTIAQVQDQAAWNTIWESGTNEPAWCYYNGEQSSQATYGLLYNWFAFNDSRGFAPEGWHVATEEDYAKLFIEMGGDTSVIGGYMKATTLWNAPNTGATDSYGFTALPGGIRWTNGVFYDRTLQGFFWTSTSESSDDARYINLFYDKQGVLADVCHKEFGFSVRLVHD